MADPSTAEITADEAAMKEQLLPRSSTVHAPRKSTVERLGRRIYVSEQYLKVFEKSFEMSTFRRGLFRFFTGLVGYVQLTAALLLLTYSITKDFCRMYVASLPLVMLATEALVGSLLCLIISIRLACRAEIFQVWLSVLANNLSAVLASTLGLVVASSLYRDAQDEVVTGWETVPIVFALVFHLTMHILIKDRSAKETGDLSTTLVHMVVTTSLLLVILFYVLHETTGVAIVSAYFPIPLCLSFLIALGSRDLTLHLLGRRGEFDAFGVARDALALAGYGVLLVPALELCLTCAKSGTCGAKELQGLAWVSPTVTVPLGLVLLGPLWCSAMGKWSEHIAFGFLSIP